MNREGERYRSKTVKTYAEIQFDRIVFRAITQLKVAWKWRKELCCDSIQIESGRLENSRTLLRFFLDSLSLINHEMNESEKKGSKGVFDTKQFSFSTVKFTRDLANWLLTFYYSHLLEFLAEKICTTFSRKIFSKPREWTRSHFRDRWPSEEKIQRIVILHERGTICFFNEIRNS